MASKQSRKVIYRSHLAATLLFKILSKKLTTKSGSVSQSSSSAVSTWKLWPADAFHIFSSEIEAIYKRFPKVEVLQNIYIVNTQWLIVVDWLPVSRILPCVFPLEGIKKFFRRLWVGRGGGVKWEKMEKSGEMWSVEWRKRVYL